MTAAAPPSPRLSKARVALKGVLVRYMKCGTHGTYALELIVRALAERELAKAGDSAELRDS